MARKFVPVTWDLIEEGRFAKSVNEALQEAATKLIAYVEKHGVDLAAKAKVQLVTKVTIQFDGTDEGDYSVKAELSSKYPGRPVHVTKAIEEQEQTGERTLFVRASGSDGASPRQQKLATDDGRTIDPKTGKAKERE